MNKGQKGFIIPLIIAIFALLAIAEGVYVYVNNHDYKITPLSPISTTTDNIVGNDRDIHGCIGSAGYSWCAVKNKCLRIWEEKCEATSTASTTNQTDLPVINSPTPSSGSKGTVIEIKGKNLSGLEGDLNVYFERPDGKTVMLTDTFGDYPKTGGSLIKVKVVEPCQPGEKVIGAYSGIESVCNYVGLTPGTYKVYTEPWGVKSNVVNFTITANATSCVPNWTCGWGPCIIPPCAPSSDSPACTNGSQSMVITDTNNCGLSSSHVSMVCPALARVCATTSPAIIETVNCAKAGEAQIGGGVPTTEQINALKPCCAGLSEISADSVEYQGHCVQSVGSFGYRCSPCGNNICETNYGENKCTCPLDCK